MMSATTTISVEIIKDNMEKGESSRTMEVLPRHLDPKRGGCKEDKPIQMHITTECRRENLHSLLN